MSVADKLREQVKSTKFSTKLNRYVETVSAVLKSAAEDSPGWKVLVEEAHRGQITDPQLKQIVMSVELSKTKPRVEIILTMGEEGDYPTNLYWEDIRKLKQRQIQIEMLTQVHRHLEAQIVELDRKEAALLVEQERLNREYAVDVTETYSWVSNRIQGENHEHESTATR